MFRTHGGNIRLVELSLNFTLVNDNLSRLKIAGPRNGAQKDCGFELAANHREAPEKGKLFQLYGA